MPKIILIAHNLRSAHNVGSLFRTAEGLGVQKVYLTGYTPYPLAKTDKRLPHLAQKIDRQIAKTSLGAEKSIAWEQRSVVEPLLGELRAKGYRICALEQSPNSQSMARYKAPAKISLIIGREVDGIESEVLDECDDILEIPMFGDKESFNVVQAAAMALYQLTLLNP